MESSNINSKDFDEYIFMLIIFFFEDYIRLWTLTSEQKSTFQYDGEIFEYWCKIHENWMKRWKF